MSSIARQKNGRYRARYPDPNGRTRSVTFDRLGDARRFLAGMGGGLARGEFVDPAQARTRFDDWAEAWWQTTTGLRLTTRRIYRDLLDRHVMPYFAGRKVGSVDYASVELWIADRRKAGLSPKTVRECLTALSLILKFAVKSNAVSRNAAAGHQVTGSQGAGICCLFRSAGTDDGRGGVLVEAVRLDDLDVGEAGLGEGGPVLGFGQGTRQGIRSIWPRRLASPRPYPGRRLCPRRRSALRGGAPGLLLAALRACRPPG